MHRSHRLICVVAVLAAALLGWRTTGSADDDLVEGNGLWLALFDNGSASRLGWDGDERLLTWFDAHARFLDDTDGFNQSILRPGLGWKTGESTSIWAGYAWIDTTPVTGDDFDEHRIWQQFIWTPSLGRFDFQARSRFEQRYLETGDDVGLRWRQLARAQTLIHQCPQITLVAWDELFIHLNDTDFGAQAGLDQNRLFLGFGYQRCPHAKWRTEIGYLNQTINQPGRIDRSNHILSINFFH